jgi:hypothetical protein
LITKTTVFVLGAGASEPYGLPVGRALYQSVLDHCRVGNSGCIDILNTTPFTERHVTEFLGELKYFGLSSVDAFLEKQPSFLEIGKAAIAAMLIVKEDNDALWAVRDANWMMYLYGHMMADTIEQFADNKIAFITFNYDRSLEHFLSVSLSKTYHKTLRECAAVFDRIPVIHLHGRLGSLPWQNENVGRDYNPIIDQHAMNVCLREIKIVHEDIADRDKDFQLAKKFLAEAECVYLMGFGFGKKNVDRLGLAELFPKGNYLGTAYEASDLEMSRSRKLLGNRIGLYNCQSIQFLRNYASLE